LSANNVWSACAPPLSTSLQSPYRRTAGINDCPRDVALISQHAQALVNRVKSGYGGATELDKMADVVSRPSHVMSDIQYTTTKCVVFTQFSRLTRRSSTYRGHNFKPVTPQSRLDVMKIKYVIATGSHMGVVFQEWAMRGSEERVPSFHLQNPGGVMLVSRKLTTLS